MKDCVFKNTGCKGGRDCHRARDLAARAMIGELQEVFVGPIQEGKGATACAQAQPTGTTGGGLMEAEAAKSGGAGGQLEKA